MASLIESVRKLHGPTLVEHDNGYDLAVICPECTRLRTDALERASPDESWVYGAELAHVPYPCPTRVVAGTTAEEGKAESARMRLEHLVVQREELEERMERLDTVIGLIRRELGDGNEQLDDTGEDDPKGDGKLVGPTSARSKKVCSDASDQEGYGGSASSAEPKSDVDPADDFNF